MTGEYMLKIIVVICTCGWIPVWFLFNGIAKVIRAFKGLDDYGYDNKRTTYEENVNNKEDDE